ncbi:MAG: sulfite exporter TauE/SafE family protein [Actinomycetota bacterium]
MTPLYAALGVLVGLVAGIGSGLFGVGGGIVTTPAINVLLGGTAIQAVATPLPVILPTSLVGALTYGRAGEVSVRAFLWALGPGIVGAVTGAELTDAVNAHLLLVITSVLIGWTAIQITGGRPPRTIWERGKTKGWKYGAIGLVAGFVSGLLGIGGGIVMVPLFTTVIGMPLKRALGTSLATMSALVIPGTIVHEILGHIDWRIFAVLTIGVIPGAWIGSKIAIGAKERSLRIAVGAFLLAIAVLYGVRELLALVRG